MDITEMLLSDATNRELVCLLVASGLHESEKQLWLTMIPVMSDEDKKELKTTLESQIQTLMDYDEILLAKFITKTTAAA